MRVLVVVLVGTLGCEGSFTSPRPTDAAPPTVEQPPPADGGVMLPAFAPVRPAMQRLTQSQLRRALLDLFGVEPTSPLPPESGGTTFASIAAARVASSEQDVELYRALAVEVAETLVARGKAPFAGCHPSAVGDACVTEFLSKTGRRLFRRSLSTEERATYQRIITAGGASAAQLEVGMRWALIAMLQSPAFLYQAWEVRTVEGQSLAQLTGRSMAVRLAFFLWDSLPDEALLVAGESGALETKEGVAAQVRRMLADARARALPARFFSEAWGVSSLTLDSRSATLYPMWSASLLEAMRTEFGALVNDVSNSGRDLRELLSVSGANPPALSAVYGTAGWDSRRRGLLSSAAVLTASNTHIESSAPILRGLFVMEKLLCSSMPSPDPSVLAQVLEEEMNKPPRPNRTRVEERRANAACWGCHQSMDPVGTAFEDFDGIGRFRTLEADGFPVDSHGSYAGKPVDSVPALSSAIAADPRLTKCMTQQMLSAAAGHVLVPSEARAVDAAWRDFGTAGYRFSALVEGIATSDAFRLAPQP